MYFAKATDVGGGQTVQVDQVAVTVSPQHFKALCNSFVETLKAYENSFGELRILQADVAPARGCRPNWGVNPSGSRKKGLKNEAQILRHLLPTSRSRP